MSRRRTVTLTAAAIVALVVVAGVVRWSTHRTDPDIQQATDRCRQAILDQIATPTAEFGELSTVRSGKRYDVTGTVDWRNKLDARVRGDIACELWMRPGDHMELVDAQLDER